MAKVKKNGDKSFLVQGSVLAAAGVITKIIGAVYRVPLVNILGDKGMGYYGVAFQIYAIALTLTSYSLPLAVSKLVSARNAVGQYRNAHKVFRIALSFAFTVGGSAALLIFFGADIIASHIMKMSLSAYALRVLAPCILVVAVLGVFRGFFQGNKSMIPTAFSQVLEQIVNAAVSIMGAYFLLKLAKAAKKGENYSLAMAAVGGTLGTVAGAVFALLFLMFVFAAYQRVMKRQRRRDRTRRRESYEHIFRALLFTIAPVLLSSTVYNLSGVIDNAMFGTIMSAQGHAESDYAGLLGILSGKYDTIINVPLAFSNALGASLVPSLVATAKSGNRRQVNSKISLFVRFNMMIAIPSAVGLFVLAKPILDLIFFTENNDVSAKMLQIGAVSVIFYCLSTVTNAVHQGLDNMMVPVKSASISLVVHIVSLFVMMVVFQWGIYGVVVSKIVFSATASMLNSHALRQKVGYIQEQKKTFLIPLLASAIMGALSLGAYSLFRLLIGQKPATLVAMLIAVAAYGAALVLLGGVSEEEMAEMPKGRLLAKVCRKVRLFR
ncbi:MAG: polysaccharide biosynthesis protein [Dorea sp.]|jgi:O-antigen/teichoic acid export membrane protein|nr:polysaccharide biosynthesis protein [Dorea sp.]